MLESYKTTEYSPIAYIDVYSLTISYSIGLVYFYMLVYIYIQIVDPYILSTNG